MRLIPTLFALLLVAPAWAAVPSSLNYQGYLTDRDGSPEVGNTLITFSIYAVEVGGSPLWFDTLDIDIESGLLSVQLGRPANPFPVDLFETPLWLGIKVELDNEMIPRRSLTSVAFSFRAEDAGSLQGKSAADLDQSLHLDDLANPHGVTVTQIDAATSAEIAALQAQLDGALATIAVIQGAAHNNATTIASVQTDLVNEITDRIADVDAEEAARLSADGIHDTSITDIQANTVLTLDGILTHPDSETALFAGVNVKVVNGTGTTDGTPNGTGNVIVGYDTVDTGEFICSLGELAYPSLETCETGGGIWAQSHKSGSHNVVVGDRHNYSRFGGVVVGLNNNITGEWSSVSAGSNNSANHLFASISGGSSNTAGAEGSSVSAGRGNTAGKAITDGAPFDYGAYSSISGGSDNINWGSASTIVGGYNNSIEELVGPLTVIGNNTGCGDYGVPSFDVCAGTFLEADFIYSTLRYFSDITDSSILRSSVSDSSVNANWFKITPSSAPTSPSAGNIYVDDSNALCVYLDDAWIKIAGTGSCE